MEKQYIPGFFSNNIRIAEYLGSIVPLVSGNGFSSWSVSITHNLDWKTKRITPRNNLKVI